MNLYRSHCQTCGKINIFAAVISAMEFRCFIKVQGLFWLLMIVCGGSYAQMATVIDEESGEPLDLVTLTSADGTESAVTNANGKADVSPFIGAESLVIRRIGYVPKSLSYNELAGQGFSIKLSPASLSLEQVVVAASRFGQSSRDVPAKVSSVTPRDVQLKNPQTAADLLATSGEVFIQKSQQGGGSPMIRGFATNRLLLTIDGVRMNTAIFRSGNLQNVISLDPFAIARTEVLFGPGSVIYGSDAIGGVMSFYTLKPRLVSEGMPSPLIDGSATMRYSSANNERTGHMDVSVGWKKWGLLTSFSHFTYGDLRMGRHGPEEYLRPWYVQRVNGTDRVFENDDPLVQKPTGYSQNNLMQKLRYAPNSNWDITYGFHYSETTDYPRYDRLIRTRDGEPRSAEWRYGPQVWMMNLLTLDHRSASGPYDEMNIRLAWQFFEESRIDRDFNEVTRFHRTENVDAYSANFDFTKNFEEKHKLVYGLEAVYNDVRSKGIDENIVTGREQPGPSRYPKSDWSSYAAYLTYQYKPSAKLLLQGGLRYNLFMLNAEFDTTFYPFPFTEASINNSALTGSAGVVYSPQEKLSLTLNLSTGFRSPNIDDVGKVFDSEPGSVVVPNPSLKAEYAYNGEIGVSKLFSDWLKLEVWGYYTLLDDAMVRRDYTLNGMDSILYQGGLSQVQAIQNAARARVYGLEAGLEINLPRSFGFSTDFNIQQGEEELDNGTTSPLRHAAPWFALSALTYSKDKLRMELSAMYSGDVPFEDLAEEERGKPYLYALNEDGNSYSPGWYTLNIKVVYKLMKNLSVSGGMENITDQRYRPYSSGLAAAGRNFIIALRADF